VLQRARLGLGTLVEIRVAAPTAAIEQAALQAAFAAVGRVHAAMSFHAADSELSRLNREAAQAPQRVSADTAAVLGSVRAPMGPRRFLSNVLHAPGFTRYRIERVPRDELIRCGLEVPEPTRPSYTGMPPEVP